MITTTASSPPSTLVEPVRVSTSLNDAPRSQVGRPLCPVSGARRDVNADVDFGRLHRRPSGHTPQRSGGAWRYEFAKPKYNHPDPLLDDPASTNGHAVVVPVGWFDVVRIDETLEQNTGSDRAAAV